MSDFKTPRIVVVGSLNMDLVVTTPRLPFIGETIEGSAIHYVPGGKGANQAVACARLGANTQMIGAVGDDLFGADMLRALKETGVATEGIARLKQEASGTATILHTPNDNCIVIVPGANGRVTPELLQSNAEYIQSADLMLVQLEIPTETVWHALSLAKASGVRTILNPAPACLLPDELLKLCDYITPNETEFLMLNGKDTGIEGDEETWAGWLRAWEEKYGSKVVLTRGSKGASYLEEGQMHTVSAPSVDVVDTTGAGDCLNGALGYALAQGKPLHEALVFAVKAASVSVTRFGAQAGMPTLAQLADS